MYVHYIRAGVLAAACAASFVVGGRLTASGYEARLADVSAAIAAAQVEAVERHNLALEVERKRADAALATRGKQRQMAQAVKHEIAQDTDRSCEWRDIHRLRLEQLYAAYGHDPAGSAPGVPHDLPAATDDESAARDVGGSDLGLGRGLRVDPQ